MTHSMRPKPLVESASSGPVCWRLHVSPCPQRAVGWLRALAEVTDGVSASPACSSVGTTTSMRDHAPSAKTHESLCELSKLP